MEDLLKFAILLITFVGFVNSVIWADVWQGPSFSLAWLGITGAAAIGFTSIRCIKRMIALVSVGALGAFSFIYRTLPRYGRLNPRCFNNFRC